MESIGPRELAADLRGGILSPGFRNSVLDSSEPTTPVQNRRTQQRPFLSHLPRSHGLKKVAASSCGGLGRGAADARRLASWRRMRQASCQFCISHVIILSLK